MGNSSDTILELVEIVDDGLEIPDPFPRETAEKTPDNTEAYVLALLGVHGGAGVSSLAVQTAYDMAVNTEKDILLIDMNFEHESINLSFR